MSVNLSYIKTRNSLNLECVKSDLANAIITRVQGIENFQKLLHDKELCVFICSAIENTVESKKIDKKALVVYIYKKLFEITDEDVDIISSSINFICDNGLVVKVGTFKKYTSIIGNYIKNKL